MSLLEHLGWNEFFEQQRNSDERRSLLWARVIEEHSIYIESLVLYALLIASQVSKL